MIKEETSFKCLELVLKHKISIFLKYERILGLNEISEPTIIIIVSKWILL